MCKRRGCWVYSLVQAEKKQGNALFHQGFAITNGDRRIWPLSCCFLTPSAPAAADRGTSWLGLNGKCCQLNPDAVSRAFIKPTYQAGIKPTRVLQSNAGSPPIALKALLIPLCPALLLGMPTASTALVSAPVTAEAFGLKEVTVREP